LSEETETHEFDAEKRINTDNEEFAQLSTGKHMAFFRIDLNEPMNLTSGLFSAQVM
jgi:hypothetical protein